MQGFPRCCIATFKYAVNNFQDLPICSILGAIWAKCQGKTVFDLTRPGMGLEFAQRNPLRASFAPDVGPILDPENTLGKCRIDLKNPDQMFRMAPVPGKTAPLATISEKNPYL